MNRFLKSRSAFLLAGMAFLLSACGGAGEVESGLPTSTFSGTSTEALLAQGSKLNTLSLRDAQAASLAADQMGAGTVFDSPGSTAVPKSAYDSGAVSSKASEILVPVWRFFNSATGAHFVTRNADERDYVITNLSPPKGSFQFEGEAFKVASAPSLGLSPVHRFFNTQTGVHFYTISEAERAHIAATLPQFKYEGVAFYASQVSGSGMTPLYRFYAPNKGFHFFTANAQERDYVIASLSAVYQFEGVGFWVLSSDWAPEPAPAAVLPHSGTKATQCFVSGVLQYSHQLCSSSEALALNPQQDGHRLTVNPMSFSKVGAYPLTDCVKDNVTGLVWEGKESGNGPRSLPKPYTNMDNGAVNDASGYAAYVNGLKLCGYSDWRLPTVHELLGIVDFGRHQPSLQTEWFPNWGGDIVEYWTSSVHGADSRYKASIIFSTGSTFFDGNWTVNNVRLVRGGSHTSPRYSYASIPYGNDAANNVVIDAWTGLQWRRCEQGRTWSGSGCSGTVTTFSHPGALIHARDQTGWRLPNVKELASLMVVGPTTGATVNLTAFPGAAAVKMWSSTPTALGSVDAHLVSFLSANVSNGYRFPSEPAVRLVRTTP